MVARGSEWLPLSVYKSTARKRCEGLQALGVLLTFRSAREIYRAARDGVVFTQGGNIGMTHGEKIRDLLFSEVLVEQFAPPHAMAMAEKRVAEIIDEQTNSRIKELENILRDILSADEGGQGVGFSEAMGRALKAMPR